MSKTRQLSEWESVWDSAQCPGLQEAIYPSGWDSILGLWDWRREPQHPREVPAWKWQWLLHRLLGSGCCRGSLWVAWLLSLTGARKVPTVDNGMLKAVGEGFSLEPGVTAVLVTHQLAGCSTSLDLATCSVKWVIVFPTTWLVEGWMLT